MIKEAYKDDTMVIINNVKDPERDDFKKINNIIGENSSINQLLREFQLNSVITLYRNLLDIKLLALHDPKVDTYLVYSNVLNTEAGGYEYDLKDGKINFDNLKSMYYTNGDGTVPESLSRYPEYDHIYDIDQNSNLGSSNWYNIVDNKLKIDKWSQIKGSKIVTDKKYAEHMALISANTDVHNYIIKIVNGLF